MSAETQLVEHTSRQSELQALREVLQPSEVVNAPSLQLVNTRVFLREWQDRLGENVRLCDLPPEAWNDLTENHDAIWLMGIYPPSEASQEISRRYAYQYADAFPGLQPKTDVVASPFAVPEYVPAPYVSHDWQEWDEKIYGRLNAAGKKVYLDFVSNHVAKEHPWTQTHPNRIISAPLDVISRLPDPLEFSEVGYTNGRGPERFAHGRDPWSPPWTDTLQLNYADPSLCKGQLANLLELSEHSDGVRCDMAQLALPENFLNKWSWLLSPDQQQWISAHPFWPTGIELIQEKMRHQGRDPFDFFAEAYADHDIKRLLASGFTGAYEKEGLYQKLIDARYHGYVQNRLLGHITYLTEQIDSIPILFTENHDEPRAIEAFGGVDASMAAAAITGLLPRGVFMTHQGQDDGRRVKLPMQVNVTPSNEIRNPRTKDFYKRLLTLRRSRLWQQGEASIPDHRSLDPSIIAQQIELDGVGAIVCTNFSESTAQGAVALTGDHKVSVYDLMENRILPDEVIAHPYEGHEYVQIPGWGSQLIFYQPQ